jgi:O-antigen/teichoic acid export membrane protein
MPELKYALLVLTCSLAITGLYSVDIVVVKHYFDPHTAGLYAGISAVARIVFFLTVSVTQVLMPAVRINQDAKHNSSVLFKSLILLTVVGGSVLVIFWFAPSFVISRLMGDGYSAYANLLPRLSLFVFIISILNLFVTYHMALRRYGIALVSVIGVAASMVMLAENHSTLVAVVNSLLYGSLMMFGALCIWSVITLKQEKRLWLSS